MIAAITGSRERRTTSADIRTIEEIVARLMFEHGRMLLVVSVGCDLGIGKIVSNTCQKLHVKLSEYRVHLYGGRQGPGDEYSIHVINKLYDGRNLSLVHVSDEFHLFTGAKTGLMEQMELLARQKVGDSRVNIYKEIE